MPDDSPSRFYDVDGRPISRDEWLTLRAVQANRMLAQDTVLPPHATDPPAGDEPALGAVRVVTEWLGTDQRARPGQRPPLVCATRLYCDAAPAAQGGAASVDVQWYAQRLEALEGHALWVMALRRARPAALARLGALLRAREAAAAAALRNDDADLDEWALVDRSDELFFVSERVREAVAALWFAAHESRDHATEGEERTP